MSDEDQRRRHPRIPTQQSVWVEGQDLRVSAQARNMSRGGMFVVSEAAPPEIGTTLQIRFDDPLEGAIEVKMEVVWREENTVTSKLGLRAIDSLDNAAFDRVVSRHEGVAEPPVERPKSAAPAARPSQRPEEG
jgi:hypothetical protein